MFKKIVPFVTKALSLQLWEIFLDCICFLILPTPNTKKNKNKRRGILFFFYEYSILNCSGERVTENLIIKNNDNASSFILITYKHSQLDGLHFFPSLFNDPKTDTFFSQNLRQRIYISILKQWDYKINFSFSFPFSYVTQS